MKKVFERNDKFFFWTLKIFIITTIILALLLLACSIFVICKYSVPAGIIALVTGIIFIILWSILFFLFLSFLADIKFIRNKLYQCEDTNEDFVLVSNNKVIICSGCGAELNAEDDICPFCGKKNTIRESMVCKNCGYQLHEEDEVCPNCKTPCDDLEDKNE